MMRRALTICFGGWLLQHVLNQQLTLGAEIFVQGVDTDSDRGSTLANVGGYYNFMQEFSLLFFIGHSVASIALLISACTGLGALPVLRD